MDEQIGVGLYLLRGYEFHEINPREQVLKDLIVLRGFFQHDDLFTESAGLQLMIELLSAAQLCAPQARQANMGNSTRERWIYHIPRLCYLQDQRFCEDMDEALRIDGAIIEAAKNARSMAVEEMDIRLLPFHLRQLEDFPTAWIDVPLPETVTDALSDLIDHLHRVMKNMVPESIAPIERDHPKTVWAYDIVYLYKLLLTRERSVQVRNKGECVRCRAIGYRLDRTDDIDTDISNMVETLLAYPPEDSDFSSTRTAYFVEDIEDFIQGFEENEHSIHCPQLRSLVRKIRKTPGFIPSRQEKVRHKNIQEELRTLTSILNVVNRENHSRAHRKWFSPVDEFLESATAALELRAFEEEYTDFQMLSTEIEAFIEMNEKVKDKLGDRERYGIELILTNLDRCRARYGNQDTGGEKALDKQMASCTMSKL